METQMHLLVVIGLLVVFLVLGRDVYKQYKKTRVVDREEEVRSFTRIFMAKKPKPANKPKANVDLFEWKPYGTALVAGDFDYMGVMYSGSQDDE